MPHLRPPTTRVKTSFLVGEQADCLVEGTATDWLDDASLDFAAYVAANRGVRTRWNVPSTVFWYVSGPYYLGGLVVRHELTDVLAEIGGHVGYHIVVPWRRHGHATRMLAQGLDRARSLALRRVLLTCEAQNVASRKVITSNGGQPDGRRGNDERFWIDL